MQSKSQNEWTVASAKAHLSEVISRAQESPQLGVKPATLGPAAGLRTASEVANSDDQSALPAGDSNE